jgi:hypothetical protein
MNHSCPELRQLMWSKREKCWRVKECCDTRYFIPFLFLIWNIPLNSLMTFSRVKHPRTFFIQTSVLCNAEDPPAGAFIRGRISVTTTAIPHGNRSSYGLPLSIGVSSESTACYMLHASFYLGSFFGSEDRHNIFDRMSVDLHWPRGIRSQHMQISTTSVLRTSAPISF